MKLLVFASCAQRGVDAENEEFMGDRNGIRQPFHLFAETHLCEGPLYELGYKPFPWRKLGDL